MAKEITLGLNSFEEIPEGVYPEETNFEGLGLDSYE